MQLRNEELYGNDESVASWAKNTDLDDTETWPDEEIDTNCLGCGHQYNPFDNYCSECGEEI